MNDKREVFGWVMYDWANSAFNTTVLTALLGPYIVSIGNSSDTPLSLFGFDIEPAAIYPFAISVSVLLQVFVLPILGTIADFTRLKKAMLLGFAYVGSVATILLFFVDAEARMLGPNGAILLASFLIVLANICFGASFVVYNAFLPDIVSPDRRDTVSSRGFAMGYLGGGLLLLFNFLLMGVVESTTLAVRISLASAGLWWLVFTFWFPHRRLIQREPPRSLPARTSLLSAGIKQVWCTLTDLRKKYGVTLQYLIAYLVYNDGIQTVIVVATSFAADELKIGASTLLVLVLMIQFVAIGGALLFGYLAQQIGAKRSIMISLIVWSATVIYAFLYLRNEVQLFFLGFMVALVLGGSQALSRSLFSQLIPAKHEAEYFGFYEISERGTSWLGPMAFAVAVQLTGSQRSAILTLILFFVAGLLVLSRVNVRKGMHQVGNDPSGVVL